MRVFKDFDEIKSAIGTEVRVSDWVVVTQDRINRFAEATGVAEMIAALSVSSSLDASS